MSSSPDARARQPVSIPACDRLADNVSKFLDKAATLHAQAVKNRFSQEMHANCLERGMSSPIEHMFWIACHALCDAHYTAINPEPYFNHAGDMTFGLGVFIQPQQPIGSYRVDFMISPNMGIESSSAPVIVELDGHAFHDKDKRQRSYEKARDRFLVKQGYRVLHFTGSDVAADPFKVAHEALELAGVFEYSDHPGYCASNPLQLRD